ncbi:MAG: hypothetical protein U9O53_02300 [archaeon]|nr:hypothetical protein [archaeon]
MTPVEIIATLLGLAMVLKGLAVLLSQKKFEKWIDTTYTEKGYLKWLAFSAGILMLYYAVQNVPLANVLSIILSTGLIMGGTLLIFPEEMKKIAKKILKSQYAKIIAAISVIIGLAILYIFFR